MNILKRFVGPQGQTYTFPLDSQINFHDNFSQLLTRTKRLPGADGGFDELGDERGMSEVGTVQASFWLKFTNNADASDQVLDFKAMADYGVGRLFMQPTDLSLGERFCWARIDHLNAAQNVQDLPHKRQKVEAIWQVADPFWLTAGTGILWGDGVSKWGAGASVKWGGGSVTSVSGLSTVAAYSNDGNAYTLPTISLRPDTGQSCHDPIIRRIVNGAPVDEVKYLGNLAEADYLFIDCRRKAVWLNGEAVYNHLFSFKNEDWLRLLPGSNSLEVRFASSADAAKLRVNYYYRYTH